VRDFAVPTGVVAVLIDPTTGKLATPECPETQREYFIQGTQPGELCEEHGSTLLTYHNDDLGPRHPHKRKHKRKWWEKLKFWD
jgi:membrane carboxypeptidase/penicillin-binding protein